MEKGCGVTVGCFLLVLLVAVVVAIEAFILKLGWNFVVVDSLKLATVHMTFKVAVVAALFLSTIGGFFRTAVTKNS